MVGYEVSNLGRVKSLNYRNTGREEVMTPSANTNGKKSKPVLQLSLTGDFIREWPSVMECGRNGFNQGAVAACCLGKLPHYKGYIWKYK